MSEWKTVKLGDIGEGIIGLTYKPEDTTDNGTIVLRSGNIQNKKLVFSDIVRVNRKINNKLKIRQNDILICSRNGSANLVGKATLIRHFTEEMTFGAFMMVYRSNYNVYISHFINSPYFKRQLSVSATTTINQITKKMLDEIEIPLPPLETQLKIADILDKASSLIELRKTQIEKLDLLVKSKFIDMFGDPVTNPMGWEVNKLGNFCEITSSKRIFESEYVQTGVPFYRTKEIVELSKGNDVSTEIFISEQQFNEIKSKFDVPHKDDILISAVGTIGVTWVVPNDYQFYFKDGNLLWIKKSLNFDSTYLKFVLGILVQHHIKDLSVGSAYNALTIVKLKQMDSVVPPISLQTQFADFVKQVQQQKAVLNQSLGKLETNYKALMQGCFNGEIFE